MPTPLATTSPWVEATLARLSLDQKLAQLIHTTIAADAGPEAWRAKTGGLTPGGVFIFSGSQERFRAVSTFIQDQADLPVVVSSDAENGPGRLIKDATQWPEFMGLAAADDPRLTAEMGRSAARECRAAGVHWTLGPVVDVNRNPHNPITNTRSAGDDPARIARHATALITALQDNGLAATPKHFPGDGFDDRDQHVCRSINPLPMDAWWRLSGAAFKSAIDAGAWTIMIGHISLPAWDAGRGRCEQDFPPATVSHRLVTGLLKEELGFDGLVVTDAMGMGGLTGWAPKEETLPASLMAGCDQLLFCDLATDVPILRAAIADGRLTIERVDQCVRKVLRLKEVLGLTSREAAKPAPVVPAAELAAFRATAKQAAEQAITLVWDRKDLLPLAVAGKKVLVVHVRGDKDFPVDDVDRHLAAAGAVVSRYTESDLPPAWRLGQEVAGYDAVVVCFAFSPNWCTDCIRPNGTYIRPLVEIFHQHRVPVAVLSFGSPYHGHDYPHAPVLINAYSQDAATQEAAVAVLLGTLEARGTSPVELISARRVAGTWMGW